MEEDSAHEIEDLLEEIHQKEYELSLLKAKLNMGQDTKSSYTTNNSSANLYQDTVLLREILNSTVEAIFLVDTHTDLITYCNNRACELFGFPNRNELIGIRGIHLQKEPYSQESLDAIALSLHKTGSWTEEIEYVSLSGRIFWGSISATLVSPPNQEPFYLVRVLDIDKRKKAEEKLRESKAMAEKSLKARERFLANVSHELRTPLHGILGMATMIEKADLAVEQRQRIGIMKHSAENLLVIINDILDMAKMDSGTFELEAVPFLLKETFLSSIKPLLIEASEKGLDFGVVLPEMESQLVGDPYRLSQVVINLLGNAIKFTKKGSVNLAFGDISPWDHKNAKLSIIVSDTGVGIPADQLKSIFDEYEQAHRGFGGTGLGLAICRKLVEIQGGAISCSSKEGKGSTFEVSISYPRNLDNEQAKTRGIPDLSLLKGLHVLLVEDNKVNQMVCEHVLKNNGIRVDIAENGLTAIEKYVEVRHDLILMDIQMPDMSGEEATKVIRSLDGERSRVPIIALTANAMKGDSEKYMLAGMDGYLSKPYTEEALLGKIQKILERDSTQKQEIH